MREAARKMLMVVMAVGFLCGLAMLLYPLFSNQWNQYNANLKFQEYQTQAIERAADESLEKEWELAIAYNRELQPIILPDSFIQAYGESDENSAYMSCLNTKGDGMMGYISIPKIGENIPIYHTASEEVLQKGAGHVQGSSLPVGGESSHAAISAHRGLPGASLFTDIDQLKEGDFFYLYILDEILAYEVDRILVVEPSETEALSVVDGEDYVTLITCTPYGVNSHRLLVRGHRVPYQEEQKIMQEQEEVHSVHTNYSIWIILGLFITFVLTIMIVLTVRVIEIRRRRKKKKKKLLLTMVLLVLASNTITVEAAGITTEMSTLRFEIPTAYEEQLQAETIPVRLYRIADITAAGHYVSLTGYESLKLEELFGKVTAQEWAKKADEAAQMLAVEQWQEEAATRPDFELSIYDNQAVQGEIPRGLYLVCVKSIHKNNRIYSALPYLLALPNLVETKTDSGEVLHSWNYNVTVDLKLSCKQMEAPGGEVQVPQDSIPTSGKTEYLADIQIKPYKTGDDYALPVTLIAAGLLGIVFFVIIGKSRKRKQCLLIVTGMLFMIAICGAGMAGFQYVESYQINERIKQIAIIQEEGDIAEKSDNVVWEEDNSEIELPQIDFHALYKMNEQCVGWIYACGGDINYPIVAADNEFYLKHAFDGSLSKAGTIFADGSSKDLFSQGRIMLYGHNMRDGSMFHSLLQYWQKEDYIKENPYVYIIVPGETYVYEITTVYVEEYDKVAFPVLDEAQGGQVLDLITCEYSGENTRLIVEAVKRENVK